MTFVGHLLLNSLLAEDQGSSPWLQGGLLFTVQGQDIKVVEEFVYLGSLIHSTTQITQDINCHSAITHAAMQSLDKQVWRSRLLTTTKLRLYNTCILQIFLYGSECLAVSKTDVRKIEALNQWCL